MIEYQQWLKHPAGYWYYVYNDKLKFEVYQESLDIKRYIAYLVWNWQNFSPYREDITIFGGKYCSFASVKHRVNSFIKELLNPKHKTNIHITKNKE